MFDRESALAQWIKAIELAALPAHSMRRLEIDGTPILLVNRGGENREENDIRAFSGDCPHAGAPLDEGALCADRIVCPWHKAAFAIDDGRWLEPPALDGLSTFPVRIDHGAVYVKLEPSEPPTPPVQADHGDRRRIAVIGGGAAGAAAVATLLQSGFGGTVTMFASEAQAPYDRTCLSKFVPAGEMPPEEVPAILPERTANDPRLRIDHREIRHLDVATRTVTTDERDEATFDAVLIASGSVARRPDLPGANLERLFTLRDIGDAAAILHALEPGEHAVILGDSFIGLETASALRKRGVDVTVVAPNGMPLERALGARVGKLFREWHEAHGVVFRQGKAAAFEGKQAVEAFRLEDGDTLGAKAVIAGIGVQPATGFLRGVTLDKDGGITVDASMRVNGNDFAAGDIARFPLPGAKSATRIEHWRVAQQQARIAALNMLEKHAHYDGVPFFWTEHYDKRVDYLGHAADWDDLAISGRLGDERFVAIYSKGGLVQAVLACGCEREMAQLSERMRETLSTDDVRAILAI